MPSPANNSFVLPIDDFYLKPAASLELLRLLRMISVPRLFFLIMGDIKTMEALFFEKALGDWTRVAGPQVFASLEKRREQEVLPHVREMKARYLRKLLPAGLAGRHRMDGMGRVASVQAPGGRWFGQRPEIVVSVVRCRYRLEGWARQATSQSPRLSRSPPSRGDQTTPRTLKQFAPFPIQRKEQRTESTRPAKPTQVF